MLGERGVAAEGVARCFAGPVSMGVGVVQALRASRSLTARARARAGEEWGRLSCRWGRLL
jgi:hypothetical protein